MAELTVSVVAADREVWSGQAAQVVAKTTDGEIGILAGHEPLLATLAQGEVRITGADGEKFSVDATSGFLSVDRNQVQVVAGKASVID